MVLKPNQRKLVRRWGVPVLGALILLGAADLWKTSFRLRGASGGGIGTSSPAQKRLLAKRCRRLYQEFCKGEPDFGIGTYTDPTGEVWLDSDAEAAAAEAKRTDPHWIDSIYSPQRLARIADVEHWVKERLLEWIQAQPATVFKARDRRELTNRLKSTKLDLPTLEQGYPDEPDLLLQPQALYERLNSGNKGVRRLRLGGAYVLGTSSRFNLIFTLSHELAHAIDPCELRSTGWSIASFDRLSACFIASGIAETPSNRLECRRNDQLSETFADWMAVQISAQALKQWGSEYPEPQRWSAVGNSVRDLCEEEDEASEFSVESHPPSRVRIEKILGTHAEVRAYLGCEPAEASPCKLE